ncbi:zinc finger protein [Cryptosporidium sp. chipmunk genotype I]|uniref:zinc finger protein n=1 Tax=Cryptosporidium sp. chipmunk genotype I TaxID=1280935 RepID=UPI00351A37C9|nr:zinc finger protein [Cryptosporidium sp. chipmunk genotype I]
MSVYYRFLHEKSDSYRAIELNVTSVRTSDLKILVAEHAGLGKEYMKLFDLKVFDNDEKEAFPDDKLLPIYSRVVIQRIPWRELKEIHHDAQRSIVEGEETEIVETKLTLPSEYICKLCGFPLINPVLIKCAGSCGASACRDCVKNYLEKNKALAVKPCPSCGQRFRGSVPNKSLANMLATIDWDKFNYPVRNPETDVSKDSDNLLKHQDSSISGEALTHDSVSIAKTDPELDEIKVITECSTFAQDLNPSSSFIQVGESTKKDPCIQEININESSEPKPTIPQTTTADPASRNEENKASSNIQSTTDESLSAISSVTATNLTAELKPLSPPIITNLSEQSIETSIPVLPKAKAAQPSYSSLPNPMLPPHHAPPLIATHQLPPHPGMHAPPPFMDPWNMQGHPYPAYAPDGAPHHFHPGYPGAPFPQTGPAHPYGYIIQPPSIINPGMYGANTHFQPFVETILPICGPYLTEEQQIQLAMSFPLLSEENFELIKQAQQSVKDIWGLLPKSIRSSLLQETQDFGIPNEKKKLFKKRKDYNYNTQNNIINNNGVNPINNHHHNNNNNSSSNSAHSYSKYPSLKKRSV